MCFEETIGPFFLQEALGSLSIPRGHKEKLSALLVTPGRAEADGCAQTPLVAQNLEMGMTRHIWAVCYSLGDRRPSESKFFLSGTKGVFRIQSLYWFRDLKRGKTANRS